LVPNPRASGLIALYYSLNDIVAQIINPRGGVNRVDANFSFNKNYIELRI
jgi:hypothetical protein